MKVRQFLAHKIKKICALKKLVQRKLTYQIHQATSGQWYWSVLLGTRTVGVGTGYDNCWEAQQDACEELEFLSKSWGR